ncbi:MAG: glycosyltransferase family 4 protein [Pontiella sp.]
MKILIYDDNPEYGGHQVMACHGIEALASDPAVELVLMFNPENRKLSEKFSNYPILEPTKNFRPLDLDLVLCIQGDIAQSTKGIQAAKRAGIECISYLAIPHRMAEMGAKIGALRDGLNQRFIHAPDRFIVISEIMKQILIERGCTKPISVVQNGIVIPPSRKVMQHASHLTLGLLGRIEFNQKQQDFMARTFSEFPEAFNNCQLLITGSGPDEAALRELISGMENITLLPWQENPERFYELIDFLMIPSRFEGVPLVMLEALARGIPVIGSARDGMKDVLPEAWTFEPENSQALATTFSNVQKTWLDDIGALQEKVLAEHSLETFKENFCRAVTRSSS